MKLTEAQRRALTNLAAGRPIYYGISGMSAHGGMTQTIYALHKRGYLDKQGGISEAGRRALSAGRSILDGGRDGEKSIVDSAGNTGWIVP